MKTPQQILNDYFFSFRDGHKEKIVSAMKEYAKQWVDKCYEDFGTTHDWAVTKDEIKKEIDAQ